MKKKRNKILYWTALVSVFLIALLMLYAGVTGLVTLKQEQIRTRVRKEPTIWGRIVIIWNKRERELEHREEAIAKYREEQKECPKEKKE